LTNAILSIFITSIVFEAAVALLTESYGMLQKSSLVLHIIKFLIHEK